MIPAAAFSGLVEFSAGYAPRPQLSHVVFDFDGTISIIRQGWPEIMVPMFMEYLPRQAGDTEESVHRMLFDDIMGLNGKQTIYQMMKFAERVQERGGQPQEPLWYKHEYLRRLNERIATRISGLKDGSVAKDDLVVFGARQMLERLSELGFSLYLASGTDEQFVKEEAALLDVAKYFGPHIYGAKDDYNSFSKKMIIDRILRENNIPGAQLLAFGDGYVEIENTKTVGGFAVAVASDEANNGSGRMDEWKRQRLKGVGADVVIPDYRDTDVLLKTILGK
jgi:phosphoglycolate phosphatase-like HAD superfamily hydrolase